jgi:hypothetical protein
MLDGRLEEKGAEVVWEVLPVPDFMNTPEERWTESQAKIAAAFRVELAEREELRDKRRKLIQSDLTSLKGGVATTIAGFDDRVKDFFHKKISMQQVLVREELKILKLAKLLRDEQDVLQREQQLSVELRQLQLQIATSADALAETTNFVKQEELAFYKLRKEDALLDKSFKARYLRDAANITMAEDYIDSLVVLFRRRAAVVPKGRRSVVSTASDSLELDREEDCPDGLEDALWMLLVIMRNEKIGSEAIKVQAEKDLAEKKQFLSRRKAEHKALVSQRVNASHTVTALRKSRLEESLNIEVLINIKQGQVEINHTDDFEPDYDSAVLLSRSVVEQLNEKVIALADSKITHMTEKMKKQSGIHMLEWEHKRLGMLAADLQSKTKDVHGLRVTRHMTLDGAGETNEEKNRRENDVLEKTIKQQQGLLESMVADRKRQALALTRKIRGLDKETSTIVPEIQDLSSTVDERATMCRVHMTATGGKSKVDARLQAASSRRALVETVKAQADEISFLRDELERRRMKTFPAFIPGQHVAF